MNMNVSALDSPEFKDCLTQDNFLIYAISQYQNVHCISEQEFYSDINLLSMVKGYITKHLRGHEINFRILINYIVVLNNVFGSHATNRLLFFKCDPTHYNIIWTALEYLSISQLVPEVKHINIENDKEFMKILENL